MWARRLLGWYGALHAAGHDLLQSPERPDWLRYEWDVVDARSVRDTARRLGLKHLPVWRLAATNIAGLKDAMRSPPQVLDYNDFHWSNLALSRDEGPLTAVVLDFGLLGVGPRYSDFRNVLGSLTAEAMPAFWKAYGPVDEREAVLDAPVSDLSSPGRPRLG